MNTKQLLNLGVPLGEPMNRAKGFIADYVLKGGDRDQIESIVANVVADPSAYVEQALQGPFAKALIHSKSVTRAEPAPWKQWGTDLDVNSIEQMENACLLPVSVKAALMPDAHLGYGLPIGGVLATEGAVIPYAVGVDIACRMKMTVLDIPLKDLKTKLDWLRRAIEQETRFGMGAHFKKRRTHDVLDQDWAVSSVTKHFKDKAWSQLGTSGSGNHFVEFGTFTSTEPIASAGQSPAGGKALPPGEYVALLSHSGSRGTGASVCAHYSKLAKQHHPDLPRELANLAWLDLDSEDGQEYWNAMNLMGDYAAANHACIHKHMAEHLGVEVMLDVENHHNFAWKETHVIEGQEREVIVHRKGATPAGQGVLGIIPGSMASPGFVVRGKGSAESLKSASHGAGRVMSRTKANKSLSWKEANRFLKERDVTLISAGLDEVPMVYKDIHQVMDAQTDLVDVLGEFNPKLVKMAPAGERPED